MVSRTPETLWAGTFGFDAPGEIAHGIEVARSALVDGTAPSGAAQCDDIAQRVIAPSIKALAHS